VINTNLPPILHRFKVMAYYWSNFRQWQGVAALWCFRWGWFPVNIRINCTFPETRIIFLPEAEDGTILSSFVWTKHRNVTDRLTDRQIWHGYYSAQLHCEQCGRAVKMCSEAIAHW